MRTSPEAKITGKTNPRDDKNEAVGMKKRASRREKVKAVRPKDRSKIKEVVPDFRTDFPDWINI